MIDTTMSLYEVYHKTKRAFMALVFQGAAAGLSDHEIAMLNELRTASQASLAA